MIADRAPRPEFSLADFHALAELAGVMAEKMELRLVASQALELELALRDTGQQSCGIAKLATIPLIYSSADGSHISVNRTWLEFSGRTAEQEQTSGWASLIHPKYRRIVVKQCHRAFQAHRPLSAEAPLRRHDGVYRWMQGKGAPRFRVGGRFDGYVGCLIDIADYRGAEVGRTPWSVAGPLADPSDGGERLFCDRKAGRGRAAGRPWLPAEIAGGEEV